MSFGSEAYGPGTGHIFLDTFLCRGTEEALIDCYHERAREGTCSHEQDVGVKCSCELILVTQSHGLWNLGPALLCHQRSSS